ncbi:sce7726 family protein [Clavibacter sepedonicus]|uniref:Phage-related protein n=1 Tax=Clavibacter sepedonicus TaxID=31964 RepID=B0REZ4_CLASE|nr:MULTISPECIES: sce7726 family protein [Clavibacter]MBD5382992.1 sce7726 family protein [Clavibacter sp.]OQJ49288.1 hypothetical protein B5P19_14370 [Clavibacter sepedonicus]OQJ54903.1 hypothetical protein B5P20_12950 [Clavibacter sepedonicus]UUK64867.1 sce7726 family protein [Clavibacter sepedonicus]CAQ00927.1 putative phage-related protein [Clavibacter sepedonicus]
MRDVDIRAALIAGIRRDHPDLSENRVWSELAVVLGASRVDVCLVNGALTGWEIKSPRDNFDRLDAQILHYDQVLDFAHIVVTSKDIQRARMRVPARWGIVEATEQDGVVSLKRRRQARQNRTPKPLSLAQLLWRDEAMDELRTRGVTGSWSKATRWDLWDALVAVLTVDELRAAVRSRLKARPAREADRPYTQDGAMSPRLAK